MPTFTASDGTVFEDRREYRRYEFELSYTFRNQSGGENLLRLRKEPGAIDGQPFELDNLTRCEVLLLDHSEAVQADNLVDSTVLIGACCDSVFVRNCTGCTFAVACKQLRTRECLGCTFYLLCNTEPVIELSSELQFAPFHAAWPELPESLASAGLDPANNLWFAVQDFSDESSTPQDGGKNWRRLAEREEAPRWLPCGPCPDQAAVARVEAFGVPIPSQVEAQEAAGGGGSDSQGMVAFKLGTSQADAHVAFAAAQAKRTPPASYTTDAAVGTDADASSEASPAEAAPVDPCTPALPPPPPPPNGLLGPGRGHLLRPPVSPVSNPVSSPARARDACDDNGGAVDYHGDSAATVAATPSNVEVRFLFTPGDAYEGEPSAMFHKAVASTPADLASLVEWGAVSEESSEAEDGPAKVCVRCRFATPSVPPPGGGPPVVMRAATGEALRPTALLHALLAACLEPEATSGAHLVAWIEMLPDDAPAPALSVAEGAATGVVNAHAAETGAVANGAAPEVEVAVAEPKESSGHFFAGVNTQKLALLAAPPVLAPPSPARAALSAAATSDKQSPSVAAVGESSNDNLDGPDAGVASNAKLQKKEDEEAEVKNKESAITAEESTGAAVDLVDEYTLAPSDGASAEPVTTSTMEMAAAERQALQADLAVLNIVKVSNDANENNCHDNNEMDGLTPEVSSGDEAGSPGGGYGSRSGNGSRNGNGSRSVELQAVPMGNPAYGTVEEVSMLNSSADYADVGAAAGARSEAEDNDDYEGEEGFEERSGVGFEDANVEIHTNEEFEDHQDQKMEEEEEEEEENAVQSSRGESVVTNVYRAVNEMKLSVESENQALVRRKPPPQQQHNYVKQAGPAIINPQTLAEKELVTSVLRIASTLRLAQKYASRGSDQPRAVRTGRSSKRSSGSGSNNNNHDGMDSSRVTRAGLRDGIRAVNGAQGPTMGALRDDLEAFFGFCLAGQRFRPGNDGGSLSELELRQALRDFLNQGSLPPPTSSSDEKGGRNGKGALALTSSSSSSSSSSPPYFSGAAGNAANVAAEQLNEGLVKLYGNKAILRGNDLNKVLGRYAVKGMLNIESLHRAASTELKLRKLSTHNLVALWRACGPTPTQAYDDRSILEHMPPLHAARGHHVHFNEKPVHLLDLSCVLKGHLFRCSQQKRHRSAAVLATRRAKDRALEARAAAAPPRLDACTGPGWGHSSRTTGKQGAASLMAWAGMGQGSHSAASVAARRAPPSAWQGAALTPSQIADELLRDAGSVLVSHHNRNHHGQSSPGRSSGAGSPPASPRSGLSEVQQHQSSSSHRQQDVTDAGGCTVVQHEMNVVGAYGSFRRCLAANDAALAHVASKSLARLDAERHAAAAALSAAALASSAAARETAASATQVPLETGAQYAVWRRGY